MDFIFARLLPYTTVAIFLAGVCWRLAEWTRTPVPFHLTLFPVPKNLPGKIRIFVAEFFFCPTLFRQDKKLWFLTLLFHISLAMVITGHFFGIYFLREQFTLIGMTMDTSRLTSQYLGGATGLVMTASLMGLVYRRITVPYLKKLSEPDNYFSLFLVLAIVLSGMFMYLPGFRVDLPSVRSYAGGLFAPGSISVPDNKPFVVHFVLAGILLIYFPFSRMFHAAGFFVIRAMLVETPPEYPTPPGIKQRSAFATKKVSPDIPVSRGRHAGDNGGEAA
jgi:nitrate reductase gamma subunit